MIYGNSASYLKGDNTMNEKLVRAVKRQLGSTWKDDFYDIVNHGIDGGFGRFIYYSDTIPFYKRNKTEIIELVKDMANAYGESVIDFIATFRCLNGGAIQGKREYTEDNELMNEIGRTIYGKLGEDDCLVANALAWFAAEETAREYMDNKKEI